MQWYRSLYWRVAIGFVAFLAAMLVAQAMVLVWVVGRSGRTLPGESPGRFARTVALDVASALERDPQLDIARYVREQYAQTNHPFFIMLASGQVIATGSRPFPEGLLRTARASLSREAARPEGEPPGRRFLRPAPIVVGGRLAGVVVVPPRAPFGFLLRRFAPTLTLVAGGVLGLGTLLAAVLVFGPARRRLRALETAARRLGKGDLSARAPDSGGDEIAAVASAFNHMADDLAARADALASSDRARRQLLADVSHELTTPITAMRGYLETLAMPDVTLDEGTRARYLGIVSDETSRLERIVGDLLDLARIDGGGGSLTREPVPVDQLFARVAARHERACAEADVTIQLSIAREAETVVGDRDRLEQALQNLAANAIRHAPRGSTIRLTARLADGFLRIAVEDEGPGIEPEHLPRIFDRFYKADAARVVQPAQDAPGGPPAGSAPGGSGLGLSIVKAIVERHGGHVSVSSRPGRTVFEMSFLANPLPEPADQIGKRGGTPAPPGFGQQD